MNRFRMAYKIAGLILVAYGFWKGLLMDIPAIPILEQTWRNIIFHVPMWYCMLVLMFVSLGHSVAWLNGRNMIQDTKAAASASVGVMFGVLGLLTGIIWSRVTWAEGVRSNWDFNAWWIWDPKQTFALLIILVYCGYFLLRGSIEEPQQKARISAVFNLFAATLVLPAYYFLPKILGGLHPGSGEGGPMEALKSLSGSKNAVLYPMAIGFLLIGFWLMELKVRAAMLEEKIETLSES